MLAQPAARSAVGSPESLVCQRFESRSLEGELASGRLFRQVAMHFAVPAACPQYTWPMGVVRLPVAGVDHPRTFRESDVRISSEGER